MKLGVIVVGVCFFLCGALTLASGGEPFPSFSVQELTARIEKGKVEIDKLRAKSLLPTGSCWKSALEELQLSCKGMDQEYQGRLALKFTTCYNEMLGFPTTICERHTPLVDCMKALDESNRATFRDFFLHTQDMCYFIEHQLWQERTSEAVNEVTNAVVDVTKNLEDAKETQDTILQSQQESLKVQSNIIKDNTMLYRMVMNLKDVFQDVQASAMEQRQVFIEIFDKLSRMQTLVSWIQGEMSLLDMMGFYFACIVFGFFGTASERTQKARFWIVILMICSLGLERFLYNYLNKNSTMVPEAIQEWIWILRRIAAIIGVLIILIFAAYYRDPATVHNNMLTEMNRNLAIVMAYIEDKRNGIQFPQKAIEKKPLVKAGKPLSKVTEESDSDSYSEYTNDSDDTDIVHSSQPSSTTRESSYNDENKVPETDSNNTSSLYKLVMRNVTSSPLRERSVDRSSVTNHSYNLRRRISENSEVLSPTAFVKRSKRMTPTPNNRTSSYFSSDDEQ